MSASLLALRTTGVGGLALVTLREPSELMTTFLSEG
jgi:hypothetical protein